MMKHKDTQSMTYSKDKTEYTNLMWENNKTMTAKKKKKKKKKKKEGTLGPVCLIKGKKHYTNLPLQWGKLTLSWKTATLFHRTEKLHKITDKTTTVLKRYNPSSSGTKSKHNVESIGSLKTGSNGIINAVNLRNHIKLVNSAFIFVKFSCSNIIINTSEIVHDIICHY